MENVKVIKGKTHRLYTTTEKFNKTYPNYGKLMHWRFGDTGDWVLTDGDPPCVVPVLKRGAIKDRKLKKNYYIRTICGSYMVDRKKEMCGQIAENIYTFSGTNELKRFLNREGATSKESLFAQYVAVGDDPVDAYLKIYNTENRQYAMQAVGRLLKTQRMKNMIKEEIRTVLEQEGVSPNYIVKRIKKVCDSGKRDGDVLRGLEQLAKMSGLFDSEEKNTQQLTVWSGFSPEQLEGVKSEQVLIHGEIEK